MRIRPKRYQCFECDNDPTTTEEFSWRAPGKSYTRAYQEHVLRILMNSTIEDVCLKERLGEKHVESMLSESFFGEDPLKHISKIGTLGLDEIALKKGHQNFVVIVSSRIEKRTMFLEFSLTAKKKLCFAFLHRFHPSSNRLLRMWLQICMTAI